MLRPVSVRVTKIIAVAGIIDTRDFPGIAELDLKQFALVTAVSPQQCHGLALFQGEKVPCVALGSSVMCI